MTSRATAAERRQPVAQGVSPGSAPDASAEPLRGGRGAEQGARTIAVILARAGSKGVPGKNAALIAGKPCVLWTIDAAKAAETVDVVALSTDDPSIVRLGHEAGVAVIDRPAPLASDTARVDDATRHAVQRAESARSLCERVVILYGNVPVRPVGLIDRAVRLMMETGCDSVQSYVPVGKFHPWWTARVASGGGPDAARVTPWEGDTLNHGVFRRQDLPPAYIPDGGVLVVSRRALFHEIPGVPPGPHAFLGLDRRGVISGEGQVVDIDSPIDLVVADCLLGSLRLSSTSCLANEKKEEKITGGVRS